LTDQALRHTAEARALARQYGFRMLEGLALTVAGEAHLAAGDPVAAAKRAADALDLHHQTGYRLGAARAHTVLGDSIDDIPARSHREAAHTTLVELGVAGR
jgi:hypothetical protein